MTQKRFVGYKLISLISSPFSLLLKRVIGIEIFLMVLIFEKVFLIHPSKTTIAIAISFV